MARVFRHARDDLRDAAEGDALFQEQLDRDFVCRVEACGRRAANARRFAAGDVGREAVRLHGLEGQRAGGHGIEAAHALIRHPLGIGQCVQDRQLHRRETYLRQHRAVHELDKSVGRRPARHCRTALCSESTGTISPPPSRAACATSSPAITSVSLFASATRLPARNAASVASSPAAPTMPLTTILTSGCVAASTRQALPFPRPSSPFPPLTSPTNAGFHSAACWASSSLFECPVMATTRNRSRCLASTWSVDRPIDPVEPRTATPMLIGSRTCDTIPPP